MMLATRCPYCHTTFRVVQDQLKICNGIVRCGSCRQVFNGIEQLQRADALALAAQGNASWPDSAYANVYPVTIIASDDEKSIFTEAHDDLNLILTPAEENSEQTHTPLADTPDPVFVEADEPKPAQQAADEGDPALILHLDDRKEPHLGNEDDGAAHRRSHIQDNDRDQRFDLPRAEVVEVAPHYEAYDAEDFDPAYKVEIKSQVVEPAFVKRARQQERFGRIARIVRAVLIVGLLPALFLQMLDVFHQRIAASLPKSKPFLERVCAIIECQTELPAQIDSVSVDAPELQAPSASEKTFTMNALLRNHSKMVQTWPHLELTLNDASEKPLVRRVFTAAEYLNETQEVAAGFPANSEYSVKLKFEAEPQLKPVGYHVYIFYP